MVKRVVYGEVANDQVASLKDVGARELVFLVLLPFARDIFAVAAEPLVSVLPNGKMIATKPASPLIGPPLTSTMRPFGRVRSKSWISNFRAVSMRSNAAYTDPCPPHAQYHA